MGLFRLMEKYDVDPVLRLFALVCPNEIAFDDAEEPGWFPFHFEDSIVHDSRVFESL